MTYNDVKHSEIQNAEHGCTIPGEHTRAMCGAPSREQSTDAQEESEQSEPAGHQPVFVDTRDHATTDW